MVEFLREDLLKFINFPEIKTELGLGFSLPGASISYTYGKRYWKMVASV